MQNKSFETTLSLEHKRCILSEQKGWYLYECQSSTLFEILQRDCPNGFIGTLIDIPDGIPDDPDENMKIVFNPILVKMMDYFNRKYGINKGAVILCKFITKYLRQGDIYN